MFPETKRRTLEEIGELFGDKHVVAHWYGISEEEKRQIAHDAMQLTEDGRLPEKADLIRPDLVSEDRNGESGGEHENGEELATQARENV